MKKILSYFYPITKRIKTENNGIVEITYFNGKKLLDSANANYSYGSLQKILHFGLQQINISEVNSILLLGLGGGSVVQTLRNDFGFNKNITAVELDQSIIKIALEEFELNTDHYLTINHLNALHYVEQCQEKVDLIIIDVFIDNEVPSEFFLISFWLNISDIIEDNGYFIFNASTHHNEKSVLPLIEFLKSSFVVQQFDLVEGTNTLIVGKKITNW